MHWQKQQNATPCLNKSRDKGYVSTLRLSVSTDIFVFLLCGILYNICKQLRQFVTVKARGLNKKYDRLNKEPWESVACDSETVKTVSDGNWLLYLSTLRHHRFFSILKFGGWCNISNPCWQYLSFPFPLTYYFIKLRYYPCKRPYYLAAAPEWLDQ